MVSQQEFDLTTDDWYHMSMSTIDLFVYGTLRPSNSFNDHWGIASEATETIFDCTAEGAMWNLSGKSPVYPVVNFDVPGEIVGDLLVGIPEFSDALAATHRMEIGAGYEPRLVRVKTPSGVLIPAVAYHYTRLCLGERIADGNWPAYCAKHRVDSWI